MFDLPSSFKAYLKVKGASYNTIKNYLADLNHFLAWLELTLRGENIALDRSLPELFVRYFEPNYLAKYKNYLVQNQLPVATVNRRLSTLRTFGGFCISQAWISENPAKNISNVAIKQYSNETTGGKELLIEFRKSLEAEKTSANTIKNYLADIKNFLTWVELAT
jgi:site-specific recombinase XerD